MAIYTVDTIADIVDAGDGVLSLREALALADATAAADTIIFDGAVQGRTIVLAGSQLTANSDVTIDGGSGRDARRRRASRVLLVQDYCARRDACAPDRHRRPDDRRERLRCGDPGQRIHFSDARTTLRSATMLGGCATPAVAVFSPAARFSVGEPLLVVNSPISGNRTLGEHALGGGILSYNVTLTNSTVNSGNSTTGEHASGGGSMSERYSDDRSSTSSTVRSQVTVLPAICPRWRH